jgi:hypothetical protein
MKPTRVAFFLLAFCAATFAPVPAQETPPNPDENITPDQLTEILKQEWTFLKEETDAFLKETEGRGEFETTPEFGKRVAARRQVYLANLAKRIKDQKLDTRSFGVLLKARLVSYNADKQQYAVACSVAVQAPYDIPSLVSFIPTNPFLVMQDTVVGGYRTNRILTKFKPHWMWSTDRPTAMEAKADEGAIHFRVRLTIDINQPAIKNQALLRIIPTEIEFVNVNRQTILWRTAIR